MDIICECMLNKMSYLCAICWTHYHRTHVVMLADLAPVYASAEVLLQYEVEPDTRATAIPFHEWMSYVHLDILFYYGIECILWHLLDL